MSNNETVKTIDSPQDIDLNNHGVIEASAGTGKTYTIENMVLRILLETNSPEDALTLDNILVLTFTEKATGELRARVREKINAEIKELISQKKAENSKKINHLKQNISLFDKAAIYTIHGFCQRVLQDYPFETNDSFKNDIIDDSELYPKLLAEIMRQWTQKFGNSLPQILQILEFSANGNWEKKVLNIVKGFHPDSNDVILPKNTNKNIDINSIIKESISDLHNILPSQEAQKEYLSQISKFIKKKGDDTGNFKEALQNLLTCDQEKTADFLSLINPNMFTLLKKYPDDFFKGKPTETFIEKIHLIVKIFKRLQGVITNITKSTIIELRKKANLYKQEKSLLSFDDMIMRVDKALKNNSHLGCVLNKRFRYGLIDEFQDTDPRQWNIFKNIFLTPANSKSKLFIIGDPKQAIYSFRGAELTTYNSAKEELKNNQKAIHYNLRTNYRSTKEVIAGINDFFKEDWFEDLDYPEAQAPAADDIFSKNMTAELRQNSVVICQDTNSENIGPARFNYAIFVAQEVQQLLANPPKIFIKGKPRFLQPDDIAVISRAKANYSGIEYQFRKKEIPYSVYKKGGLYDSPEAKKILILLQTLAEPFSLNNFRKLLLTDFFSGSLDDLEDFSEISPDSPLLAILNSWQKIAADQNWGKLFRAVLEESGMLERKLNQDIGFQRSISNYEQIFEGLLLSAKHSSYDIQALYEKLKFLIFQRKLQNEDSDLHRLESEDPKVQLMTIHASKGLEFPIVFTLGDYFSTNKDPYYKFHDAENNHQLIFDLNKEKENKEKTDKELLEENKRLAYVAITRASHRIYLPYFLKLNKIYLPRIEKSFTNDQPQERVTIVDIDNISPSSNNSAKLQNKENKQNKVEFTLPDKLDNSPNLELLSKRATFLKSFSSLHFEEEQETAIDIGNPVKSPLPAGADTGNMLHDLLENLDFSLVAQAESPAALLSNETVRELFASKIKHFIIKFDDKSEQQKQLINEMIEEAARYIYNALRTPIFADSDFRLCDLTATDKKHEMEFFYPLDKKNTSGENLFLDGFIDLVFKHEGKVYLLDWKSNSLGMGHYLPDKLKDHVNHDYHDQYHIYAIAITRMLKAISPQEEFGGAVYLYLRGVDLQKPQQGIFYSPASEMDLTKFADNLNKKREQQ